MDDLLLEERLERFEALIRASPHNLMSPAALQELRKRHIEESLRFASIIPAPAGERAGATLDIGSGGGLPGIVVALARPDLRVDLLESRAKKVTFLRDCLDQLGLEGEVHHGRAEDLGRGVLASSYEHVTARAVAPLARLIEWAVPFLTPGGTLFAIKGERWEEELTDAEGDLARLRVQTVATPDDRWMPDSLAPRVIILRR